MHQNRAFSELAYTILVLIVRENGALSEADGYYCTCQVCLIYFITTSNIFNIAVVTKYVLLF